LELLAHAIDCSSQEGWLKYEAGVEHEKSMGEITGAKLEDFTWLICTNWLERWKVN
jgi:hypothetical protein